MDFPSLSRWSPAPFRCAEITGNSSPPHSQPVIEAGDGPSVSNRLQISVNEVTFSPIMSVSWICWHDLVSSLSSPSHAFAVLQANSASDFARLGSLCFSKIMEARHLFAVNLCDRGVKTSKFNIHSERRREPVSEMAKPFMSGEAGQKAYKPLLALNMQAEKGCGVQQGGKQ